MTRRIIKDVNLEYEIAKGKLKLWACSQATGQNVLRIKTYDVKVMEGPLIANQQDLSIVSKEFK